MKMSKLEVCRFKIIFSFSTGFLFVKKEKVLCNHVVIKRAKLIIVKQNETQTNRGDIR